MHVPLGLSAAHHTKKPEEMDICVMIHQHQITSLLQKKLFTIFSPQMSTSRLHGFEYVPARIRYPSPCFYLPTHSCLYASGRANI